MERNLKAMANRRRLTILSLLKKRREVSVGDIASEIGLSFKSTSKHLAILAAVNIVGKDQRSLQVYYHLEANQKNVARRILELL